MDVWMLTGFIGSIASIISLFVPSSTKKQKLLHALYVFVIAVTASYAQYYYSKYQRMQSAERAAAQLVQDKKAEYTSVGFSMAALAFLEKNRDLFPDSYARAKALCEQNDCTGNPYKEGAVGSLNHAYAQNDVSFALAGLIKGIGTLSHE